MSHSAKGESHRVYWQQWISAPSTNGTTTTTPNSERSRRELITSSAAIRIAHTGAQSQDVTHLLRSTLKLGGGDKQTTIATDKDLPEDERDSLVLVGTLYSLPRDTVQFEHELGAELSRSEPYHVVTTLRPTEDPLEIRRRMEEHLNRLLERSLNSRLASRTIISPKLQWFFVPAANETNSLIPNCVELDGYCTSLEEEDPSEDDADDDDQVDGGDSGVLQPSNIATATVSYERCYEDDVDMCARFPWLNDEKQDPTSALPADVDQRTSSVNAQGDYFVRASRLAQQLSRSQALTRNRCLTGYLLKRSRTDPHVWRRVHCVLTDEYLWYVSRKYISQPGGERYSRHGRIRLTRALLLEPSSDYVPLHRIPFAFEVVTGSGTSHWFRASSQSLQAHWIQALSERIVESFESSLMDQAELIVDDECLAHSRRMMQLAVEPLWEEMQDMMVGSQTNLDGATISVQSGSMVNPLVGAILRWGIQVASYRECCRYIHNSLPAKKPVVVVRRRPSLEHSTVTTMSHAPPEPMDPTIQGIIQSTWSRAAELLTEATRLALQMQPKMPHSIETQSQHIDYIIHGRFRSNSCDQSTERADSSNERLPVHSVRDPPPTDLFDHLLSELQALVVRVWGENNASAEIATNGGISH